jgi:molecular chaperone GrpE (heat shock protein)
MADEKITQDETLEKEPETQVPETEETVPETPEAEAPAEADPLQEAQEALKQEHDNYLRLAAEYDNFRKRSQKEKDTLFRDGKASAIEKFLPVYDNLSRALEQETAPEAPDAEAPAEADPLQEAQEALKQEHDNYLRLAAEYDNFRKRSQKEKDTLFRDGKASAIEKFLPVYDNLSRALEQETADTAYK